jgi:hypothetical protein
MLGVGYSEHEAAKLWVMSARLHVTSALALVRGSGGKALRSLHSGHLHPGWSRSGLGGGVITFLNFFGMGRPLSTPKANPLLRP